MTNGELLKEAQRLVDKYGEDGLISCNVVGKEHILKLLRENNIDLMNGLTNEILKDLFYIMEKEGVTNDRGIVDILYEFSLGSRCKYELDLKKFNGRYFEPQM